MHPELRRLEEQYLELVAALQAGHLSQDDAQNILTNLVAVDGKGAMWSLDPFTGEFIRTFPGQQPVATDPSLFAPAQLPAMPVSIAQHGSPGFGMPAHMHPALQPMPHEPAGRRALAAGAGALASLGKLAAGPAGLFKGKGRTIAIPALIGVVVVLMVLRSPLVNKSETVTKDVVTTTQAPAVSISIPGQEPITPPALPTDKLVREIVSDLQQAKAGKVAARLAAGRPVRLAVSSLLGAPRAGFSLVAGAVTQGEGGAALVVTISDGSEVLETWKLILVQSPQGWVISTATRG